jgi:hypothetical protein
VNYYEPLPIELTMNGGHHYSQVWRNADAAVYEQRGHYQQLLGYEAIAIKRQEATTMFGRSYPSKELYPNSEDWGRLAVTKDSIEAAKDAAIKLAENHQKAISSVSVRQRRTRKGGAATPLLLWGGRRRRSRERACATYKASGPACDRAR